MPARRPTRSRKPASESLRGDPAAPEVTNQPARGKPKIKSSDLRNLKDLRSVRQLLERLHTVGLARDKAGNRELRMDEYCLLILMWIFNPVIDSLRGIQQATTLDKVRKRLGVGRSSLGSLSESVRVFDPELLAGIAEEMAAKIPDRTPGKFGPINKKITAVDGSVFRLLRQVASLAWLPKGQGKSSCGYRLHAQFEVFKGIPSRIDLTPANPKGAADERVVLEKTVAAGHCYVIDRGYEKYLLWNVIHTAGSNYAVRVRDNFSCQVLEDLPLTDADRQADIVSDQLIQLGSENSRTTLPDHPTRLVIVKVSPHDSRKHKGESGPDSDGYLRIVTDILDVPAEIIAALYLLRWTIEIFFRIIKQLLGCRHLLSTKPEGVEIQMYMALIACIMILALTGKQPTKRTFEMICFFLQGWASLDELEAHLRKLADAPA